MWKINKETSHSNGFIALKFKNHCYWPNNKNAKKFEPKLHWNGASLHLFCNPYSFEKI